MKLEERERIEGTDITIGRRVYYKDGATVISPRWAAEYREGTGKQVCVNLATGSKTAARRKALALHAKLEDGQPHVADARLGLEEIVDAYFAFAKAKGVAKKTEWKYRADLDKLKTFCKEQQITLAMRFVGAFVFGRLGDRFGRKPILMLDIVSYSVVGALAAFAPTLWVFLLLRALFGIAMGGEWGLGSSLAMESIPPRARATASS